MPKSGFLLTLRLFCLSTLLALSCVSYTNGKVSINPVQAVLAADDAIPVYVHASMLADCKAVTPGKKFRLGILLKMEPGWHTYYREAGEAGQGSKVEWELPPGFKASELMWERPHKMVDSGITTYGYNDHTMMSSVIEVPAGLKAGSPLKFSAKVKWLSCKDACVPGKADVTLTLPVAADGAAAAPDHLDEFKKVNFNGPSSEITEDGGSAESTVKKSQGSSNVLDAKFKVTGAGQPLEGGIWAYLGFAFIGGFILNFMPCVLPVISIKVFSLIQQAGEDPKRVLQHGVTFATGIILSFLALGALVIAIQSAGQKIGWGFQFQYPVFILCMSAVVTLFALSMFGVFYFSLTAGQKQIDELASSEGLTGTFFKGVLATVLSTPCTAPFLGTALGFAFVQPWWEILSIFLVIALGMSSPYLVLAVRPDFMKFLPKPGDWMEKFKESMGFLLLATVVWLISVLSGLVDPDAVIAAISFLVCISVAAWMVGGFINLSSSGQRQLVVWGLSLGVVAAGYFFFLQPFPELLGTKATIGLSQTRNAADGIQWQDFSLQKLDTELKANKTVFIDFTAKWCLTCKVNEGTIINTPPVIEKFKALNVVPLKADWTAQDADISDLLKKFGRSGVPVYVIFPAGHPDEPMVLPEALTQPIVLESLDKAGPSK